ncbi:hypothetical protein J8273_2169 [Carpediemonas membranifera]|uniref:Uncharacterized protein n=1 Tax=Carpediemonas membranifera TaxID=201153 RepID=A0A8J6B630_9EUKA|nr:hypothetical protein J8273_2169 [Carpediemonas membranifera]|eukprot:KAG9396438.1 hypothetical protein J8273_2169 [Carpediemonas membranifera]
MSGFSYGKAVKDFLDLEDVTELDIDLQDGSKSGKPAVKNVTPDSTTLSSPQAPISKENTEPTHESTPAKPTDMIEDGPLVSPTAAVDVRAIYQASPPHTVKPLKFGINTPGTVKIPVPRGDVAETPVFGGHVKDWSKVAMSPAYVPPAEPRHGPARPLAIFSPEFQGDFDEAEVRVPPQD